jgi:hypothetical protein
MKPLAISVVVLGALLFGAVTVSAGWGWNAKADIEGTTISTAWSVANGGKVHYQADITITVPANASVNVIEVAPSETVTVVHTGESCSAGVIDAVVTYVITGGNNGSDVSVSVNQVGGGSYGSANGTLGSPSPSTPQSRVSVAARS